MMDDGSFEEAFDEMDIEEATSVAPKGASVAVKESGGRKRKRSLKKEEIEDFSDGGQEVSGELSAALINSESDGHGKEKSVCEAETSSSEPAPKTADSSSMSGLFVVLGQESNENDVSERHKPSVLPVWLKKGRNVSKNIHEDSVPLDRFQKLISPIIFRQLESSLVIPELLQSQTVSTFARSRDICVATPTGSGKTLCYVIPLVQALMNRSVAALKAIVIAPVQDLALQIFEVFRAYTQETDLNVFLMSGSQELRLDRLIPESSSGTACDIIVATPGRLMDYLQQSRNLCPDIFWLKDLKYLVIDEADRVAQEHLRFNWLSELIIAFENHNSRSDLDKSNSIKSLICGPRGSTFQKILLSATLNRDLVKLQQLQLFRPKLFAAESSNPVSQIATQEQELPLTDKDDLVLPDELREYYVPCDVAKKPLICYHLLKQHAWTKVLCFCNTRENGFRLSKLLTFMGVEHVQNCSANLKRGQRERIQKRFAKGDIRFLVCTDVMARGMDLKELDCVMSYDYPKSVQTYIHRVGRTARAGKEGVAVTLLSRKEVHLFGKVLQESNHWEKLSPLDIDEEVLKKSADLYKESLSKLKECVENEHKFSSRGRAA